MITGQPGRPRKTGLKIIPLNDNWQFREASEGTADADGWLPATVPGCVYTDLTAAGRIPDPFYRVNEDEVQWVAERDWLYRTTFDVDAETLAADRIQIVCNGLDTFATWILNDQELAKTENAFVEHVVDVTGQLREGSNTLAIRFDSALRVCSERESTQGKLPGGARVYARKPQFSFGWDWGPKLPYCGIWRDIFLRAFGSGRMDSAQARTELDGGTGTVRVRVELERTDDQPLSVSAVLSKGDRILARAELHEVAAAAEVALEVTRPLLWWPNGLGEPNLYDVCIRLRKGGEELDHREFAVGFRTIEIEREPDEAGESFIFKVNGRRVFCKGANWVPADSFLSRVSRDKYRTLVAMAVDQNMNMLRVWGGGIYEADAFFAACDELGVMVWQDFMFACGDYPDTDWFHDLVREEADKVVKRLRNHPSLAVWCGNNENHMGYDNWGWPETFTARAVYHKILPGACQRLDPDRPYWPGCPYGGENSNSETHGDMHNWKVWHGGRDYRTYRECRARFVSEFGFQSFPTTDTVLEFAEPEDLSMDSGVMLAHQKCRGGNGRLTEAIELFFPQPGNFDDTMLFTQIIHGEALKTGIEHWRRLKWHNAGTLIWQLNDCWPVISWATVDGSLRPKPAYYYARRAFAPVLITAHLEEGHVVVSGINDTNQNVSGTLDLELFDLRGQADLLVTERVAVGADSACELFRVPLDRLAEADKAQQFLWLTFYSGIYDSSVTLFLAEPRDLALLEPEISVDVETDPFDKESVVRLTSPVFVKGVWLSVPGSEVRFSDNAFDLVPYVSREVSVTFGEGPPVEDLPDALRIQHCNRLSRPGR